MSSWATSSNYSSADMMRMQQQARQRVVEMQRRTNGISETSTAALPSVVVNTPQMQDNNHTNQSSGNHTLLNQMANHSQSVLPKQESIVDVGKGMIAGLGNSLSNMLGAIDTPTKLMDDVIHKTPLAKVFDVLELDGEKLLIIGLMFLLINEEGDPLLILALGYLLI